MKLFLLPPNVCFQAGLWWEPVITSLALTNRYAGDDNETTYNDQQFSPKFLLFHFILLGSWGVCFHSGQFWGKIIINIRSKVASFCPVWLQMLT